MPPILSAQGAGRNVQLSALAAPEDAGDDDRGAERDLVPGAGVVVDAGLLDGPVAPDPAELDVVGTGPAHAVVEHERDPAGATHPVALGLELEGAVPVLRPALVGTERTGIAFGRAGLPGRHDRHRHVVVRRLARRLVQLVARRG